MDAFQESLAVKSHKRRLATVLRGMPSRRILTQGQLAAIGTVTVESTFSEILVEEAIWLLADLEKEAGRVFTFGMSASVRIETLRVLGLQSLATDEDKSEFSSIVSDLKSANEDRNVVVHGKWAPNNNALLHYLLTEGDPRREDVVVIKEQKNSPPKKFPSEFIEATANKLYEAKQRLQLFVLTKWRDLEIKQAERWLNKLNEQDIAARGQK